MQNRTLEDWLQHWLAQHPREIVMGLERVQRVWSALAAPRIARCVITVAGTNGKGSTVAMIDAMLRAGGYRVGRYQSPHLLRYNERIAVDDIDVADAVLVDAFARIEQARGETALTYFEAGTLAALLIFADAGLDAAVLEVGLGGRLDAVNIIDADVAVITSIGLDHQDILGDTLEAIAFEKAGICRRGRPAVLAMSDPPDGMLAELARRQVAMLRARIDYQWQHVEGDMFWQLEFEGQSLELPLPRLAAPVQLGNAAAAIMALRQCRQALPLDVAAMRAGLADATQPGRLQIVGHAPEVVLDVAHNPQAATALVDWLRLHPRRTRAVFSALVDKDIAGIAAIMRPSIAHWHVCGLSALTPRGTSAEVVRRCIESVAPDLSASVHVDPQSAFAAARAACGADERILVFGSFYLIADLLPAMAPSTR